MNRIFGKKKEAPPPPSMTEAAGRVDGRVGTLDAKVNGLVTCLCEGGNYIHKMQASRLRRFLCSIR
jgi:hypothetical protein